MVGQQTLSAYPLGAAWCDAHPRAVAYIVQRASVDNARGRKARMQGYLEEMRAKPQEFDLTAHGTRYGFDHRDRTEVTRYIMEQYGLDFAIRKSKADSGVTQETPGVGE